MIRVLLPVLLVVAACGGGTPEAEEPAAEPTQTVAANRPKCANASAYAFLQEQRAHAAARRDDACAHQTDDCATEQRTVDLMDQSLAQDPCAGAAP